MSENHKPAQQFGLQRIYIKDLSFESPNAPAIFSKEWQPKMNLDLNNKTSKVGENLYEVVLAITISVANGEAAEPAFIVEVQQGGLFQAEGFEQEALQQLLGSYCPSILFPYAREAVSDMVGKGSFPQLLMTPVNFDALFAEAQKRQKSGDTAVQASSEPAGNDEGPAGKA